MTSPQRLAAAGRQRRRHRFTDIRVTRKPVATSRSLTPASISPAASRTCPRQARDQPTAIGIPHDSVRNIHWNWPSAG
jgi:hypothetical protein